MGLAAPFLPPASGGPSIFSWWPLPVSAEKAMVPAPCQVTLHSILVNPYFKNSYYKQLLMILFGIDKSKNTHEK
jgi:hypothetical protein